MSRVASSPVVVPSDVRVVQDGAFLLLSKSRSSMSFRIPNGVSPVLTDTNISFTVSSDSTNTACLGTAYASLRSAISDISNGFTAKLLLQGVGYKALVVKQILSLALGYSHSIKVAIPTDVTVLVEKNTELTISGFDRRKVMLFCNAIRSLRKPEPYKGKGVRFADEIVNMKEVKKKK